MILAGSDGEVGERTESRSTVKLLLAERKATANANSSIEERAALFDSRRENKKMGYGNQSKVLGRGGGKDNLLSFSSNLLSSHTCFFPTQNLSPSSNENLDKTQISTHPFFLHPSPPYTNPHPSSLPSRENQFFRYCIIVHVKKKIQIFPAIGREKTRGRGGQQVESVGESTVIFWVRKEGEKMATGPVNS